MTHLIIPILRQQAREYAAQIHIDLSESCFDDDFGFASHVTHEDKIEYSKRELQLADDIISGKMDNNFTVWQRMNYFITGKSQALLP